MTRRQKKVTAWIAIGTLCLAVILVAWLAILTGQSRFVADLEQYPPKPMAIWEFFLWFMKGGAALNAIFATLLALIAAGVTAVSEVYKKSGQLLAITILCVLGVACCVFLMVKLDEPGNLAMLRYLSAFPDNAQATSAVHWAFGSLLGWFVAFLAVQLGLRSILPGGTGRSGGNAGDGH